MSVRLVNKSTASTPRPHRIKCYWDGVLKWFKLNINNGILEDINSLIQTAKAKVRGYRTNKDLIAMIYLIGEKLNLPYPPETARSLIFPKLSIGKKLKWPNRCVSCGGEATDCCTVYGKTYSGYAFKILWHELRYTQIAVTYPVCRRHKGIFPPPVIVSDVGQHYYTIEINNHIYGLEFAHINQIEEYL